MNSTLTITSLSDVTTQALTDLISVDPGWAECSLWILVKSGHDFERSSGDAAYFVKMMSNDGGKTKTQWITSYHPKIKGILLQPDHLLALQTKIVSYLRTKYPQLA